MAKKPTKTDPPGVVDGVLVDPQTYFFSLINRQPDQPADDWEQVLATCGLPKGNPPHVKPTDNGYYGMTQQIGTDGRIAGRIFLPTAVPDDLGYYAHPVSPLKDAPQGGGHLLWEWRSLTVHPSYVPVTGDGSVVPVPPPSGGGLTEAQVQAMIDAAMQNAVKLGDKIALRLNSGKLMSPQQGGPTKDDQLINLYSKTDVHAWESLTVERGE